MQEMNNPDDTCCDYSVNNAILLSMNDNLTPSSF